MFYNFNENDYSLNILHNINDKLNAKKISFSNNGKYLLALNNTFIYIYDLLLYTLNNKIKITTNYKNIKKIQYTENNKYLYLLTNNKVKIYKISTKNSNHKFIFYNHKIIIYDLLINDNYIKIIDNKFKLLKIIFDYVNGGSGNIISKYKLK